MLLLIVLWLYCSLVCFTWGIITCRFFTRREAIKSINFPHVSILCLLGLTATGTLSMYFSLYVPLTWMVHGVIVLPAIACWCIPSIRKIMWQVIATSLPYGRINSLLMIVLIFMIAGIASSNIIHPDTLSYHLQSIRWFEQFKAVPGVANVDTELGMQSLWFASNALFRPEYLNEQFALFLNGAVLTWFFLYVCSNLKAAKPLSFFLIFLLLFTLLSWTQVRLTAASASPDFIVVLYLLAAASLYLKGEEENSLLQMIIVAFSVTAVAIKMSALVIVLLPLIMTISFAVKYQYRAALKTILLSVVVLMPVLVRNSIASGYPLFPASFLQLDVEWKYPVQDVEAFRNYIRDFARWPSDSPKPTSSGWISGWWSQQAIADQALLIIVVVSLLTLFFSSRRLISMMRLRELILLLIAISGAIVWWTMAPDPRFGTGYLLLIILISSVILSRLYNPEFLKMKSLLNAGMLLIIFFAGVYTIYRFVKFNNAREIFIPSGVKNMNYASTFCKDLRINYPVTDTICGSIPAPCIPDTCMYVAPLGSKIEDGFRKKE